ncbi:E3 ubiquitin-protein ligase TRIM56 [Holothuria leucospilota]|uniref:E3 ubiquitin-protein ligase TRIM56 n=1 Tax=Holothuria leucospilota TaxID=206669 RepID=A0A9Q1BUQ3_HOLLE|nr:E3 ubiquitin-protein ligase TRIM56 [Holothuria leucospilota]
MAMQILSKLDEEILLCSICLDTLKEPKVLGCLHRYCKKCLTKVIANVPDAETFKCPTCRQEYDVPDGGIEGIKGDFLLEAVLETRKLEKDLKEKQREQICSSCGKQSTMVAICPDCGGFICEVCHSGHQLMKVFSSHCHLVTLEDIESGKVSFNAQGITTIRKAPKCSIHEDMVLHINCQTCEKLICPVCAPIHHGGHKLEEVSSAAERVKNTVQVLAEKTVLSGTTLEEKVRDMQNIRQEKLKQISEIMDEIKQTVRIEEENVTSMEKILLKELEEKRKSVIEQSQQNLEDILLKKELLLNEMETLKDFCVNTFQKIEEEAESKLKTIRNSQITAQLLTNDFNHWSVVLAAGDVEKALQTVLDGNTSELFKPAMGSLTGLEMDFRNLKFSTLAGMCWNRNFQLHPSKVDAVWPVDEGERIPCDLKFIRDTSELILAGLQEIYVHLFRISLDLGTIDEEQCYRFLSGATCQHVCIGGTKDGHTYSFADDGKRLGLTSLVDGEKFLTKYFYSALADTIISCVDKFQGCDEMIFAVRGSTMLYRCNFKAVILSSIQVKVDNLQPPVSLATSKRGEILLCDGYSKAVAIDNKRGTLTHEFWGRSHSDRPLAISEDQRELVYVLWQVKDDAKCRDEINQEGEGNLKADASNVVRQYTRCGTFISEFIVDKTRTMMATVVTSNNEVALALASQDSQIEQFCMV